MKLNSELKKLNEVKKAFSPRLYCSFDYQIENTMKLKTLLFSILLTGFTTISFAQTTSIDKIFDDYAGKEFIVTINITPEMFKLAAGLSDESTDPKVKEINEVVNQLTSLKMIILNDSLQKSTINLQEDVNNIVKTKAFSELMTVQEQKNKVTFYIKKAGNDRITEMLMIAGEPKNVVVMIFTGNIDLKTIGRLSKTMKIDGMEQLELLNKKK